MGDKSKLSLLKIGFLILLSCFAINAVFVQLEIGGLLREIARACALIGLFLTAFGLIVYVVRKRKKPNQLGK